MATILLYKYIKKQYANSHAVAKSDDAVRIGILGAANIAHEALITPALTHPELVVYAVAAKDSERAKSFAQQHSIEKVFSGANAYQELLDNPSVNAVYIALPNSLHYEWTMKALFAGKHVLLEKPTADRTSEARKMFDYAQKQGLVLLEALHYRFHPGVLRVKAILDSGELGRIKTIDAHMHYPKGFFRDDDVRFIYNSGGGSMMDMGCYTLNTLGYLASANPSTIVSATAEPFPVSNGSEHLDRVDVGMKATLSFPHDVAGTMSCHHRATVAHPDVGLKVTCENGELEMQNYSLPAKDHSIKVSVKTGKDAKGRKTRTEKTSKLVARGKKGEETWSSYRYQLEAFVDKVRGREPHAWVTPEDSVTNMEWIEQVYEKSGLGLRPASTWEPSTM